MDKQNPKVVVVGSFNMDLVVKAGRRPQTGETLMGKAFGMFIGGKGSNQAIAAARLGANVTMIGRLGTDLFGDTLMAAHAEEGICTDYVVRDTEIGTGVASILIDADGDNSIVLVPQANMRLSIEDIERASESIAAADALLLQLEVPIDASRRAAEIAKSNGATVVLNPAPAQELPDDFLAQVDILTPNEVETESLSGVRVSTAADAEHAAKVLLDKGLSAVILTLRRARCAIIDTGSDATGSSVLGRGSGYDCGGRCLLRGGRNGARAGRKPCRCGCFCQCRGCISRYRARCSPIYANRRTG